MERCSGGWLGTMSRSSSQGSLLGALEFLCWKIISQYHNPHHQWSIPITHKPLRASQTSFTSNHNLFEGLKVGVCNLSSHRTFSITLSMAGNQPHLSFSLFPSLRKPTECPEYSGCRCRMELCTAIITFPVSFSLPFLFFSLFNDSQHLVSGV